MKTLHSYLEEYLTYLESLNYSALTLRSIHYNCTAFIRYLAHNHAVVTPLALRKEHLEGWQCHLATAKTTKGLPLKARTVNKKLETARGLLKRLDQQGILNSRLVNALRYVKQPRVLPTGILDNKDMRHMLRNIDIHSNTGYRDRAILELMYTAGLRAGEVVGLNVHDINFSHAVAKVMGKGRKERIVPVGKTALRCLENWLRGIRPFMILDPAEEALFVNAAGTRLRYHTLRTIVQQHADNAKVRTHITTHSFRRSCATEMIRAGANIYHVKELLGHEDLQSLKHYTKLTINDLRATHARCHPREKDS